jgi:hypothetical protein
MEPGFLFDRSHDEYGKPSQWVEGAPETSFWLGTKTRGKVKIPVTTWRCIKCGYLESYAHEVST